MFNADRWKKEVIYYHPDVIAKVYSDIEGRWMFEYEVSGYVNIGVVATAEVAMQRIEDHLKAGIAIRERVRA
jgi:hypothetical protein